MSLPTENKVELQVQKGIRQAEDNLVIWIQSALDNTKYGDLEESQFRNLLRVSDTTDSTEVIKNFLRYQVGRDKKWGRGQDSLAEKIVQDIDGNIKKTAQAIAESSQSDFKPIWLELIRRYLLRHYGTHDHVERSEGVYYEKRSIAIAFRILQIL